MNQHPNCIQETSRYVSSMGVLPAAAFIPWQIMRDLYDECTALQAGTIFKELNKPFCGKRGKC